VHSVETEDTQVMQRAKNRSRNCRTQTNKFINSLVLSVEQVKNAPNAGFSSPEDFRDNLEWRFENSFTDEYEPIRPNKEDELKNLIKKTLDRSESELTSSRQNITILVFPWLAPFDEFDKQMGYVNGFAAGNNTINIYLEPGKLSEEFLAATIAHEYNHLVFFHHHPSLDPNHPKTEARIIDVLIWEGLAETFSELIVGKKVSPIIGNITELEAREALEKMRHENKLKAKISDEDSTLYEDIFFGADGKYKRWTGYTIGYHVVKEYLNKEQNISWARIIKMDPEEIFSQSPFVDKLKVQ
jgi:uncharacterized protein YjaZ